MCGDEQTSDMREAFYTVVEKSTVVDLSE